MKFFKIINKILLGIILLTGFFLIVGVTYSFFTSGLTGQEVDTTITVEAGDMRIVYDGGPDITALNIKPSEEPFATKNFTITGTNTFSNDEMWYEISLIVDENTFSTNALSYTLEGVNNAANGKIISDILTRQAINNTNIKLGRGNFSGLVTGGVHTYTLKVYFYETWLDQSIDLRKKFKAHIEIEDYIPLPLNNYLLTLVDTEQGTGEFIYENGYRYEGLNPNNYVILDNELWRIIGIFDSYSHGIDGQNLAKIIRNDSIGDYKWSSSSNNWDTSSLKSYLNATYYNGLLQNSKNIIESVKWKLGGISTYSAKDITAAYTTERGTTVRSGNPIETTGHIGLIYPSDYGYAAPKTSCARSKDLTAYNVSGCYNNNWLFKAVSEWFLTTNSYTSGYVWYLHSNGRMVHIISNTQFAVRPVLYLKSNTMIISGDGTSENPYIIQ